MNVNVRSNITMAVSVEGISLRAFWSIGPCGLDRACVLAYRIIQASKPLREIIRLPVKRKLRLFRRNRRILSNIKRPGSARHLSNWLIIPARPTEDLTPTDTPTTTPTQATHQATAKATTPRPSPQRRRNPGSTRLLRDWLQPAYDSNSTRMLPITPRDTPNSNSTPTRKKKKSKNKEQVEKAKVFSRVIFWLPLKFYFFILARRFYNNQLERPLALNSGQVTRARRSRRRSRRFQLDRLAECGRMAIKYIIFLSQGKT